MLNIDKVYSSNECGKFGILEYINNKKVRVLFIGTGCEVISTSQNILKGLVVDRLLPRVCGVGFIGTGKYKSKINKVITKPYAIWHAMINRCYGSKNSKSNASYADCYVCDDWHNFQVFAEWNDANNIKDYELDKDLLVQGNKIYSPDTCLFVPQDVNKLLSGHRKIGSELPLGVRRSKGGGRFEARGYANGKEVYLGSYVTMKGAHSSYKEFKYKVIKSIAKRQAEPLKSALLSYVI